MKIPRCSFGRGGGPSNGIRCSANGINSDLLPTAAQHRHRSWKEIWNKPKGFFHSYSFYQQAPLSLGILQARILKWVAMPSSRGSFQPRDQTHIVCESCIAGRFFTAEPLGNANVKSLWGTPETNIRLYINYISQNAIVLLHMASEILLGYTCITMVFSVLSSSVKWSGVVMSP